MSNPAQAEFDSFVNNNLNQPTSAHPEDVKSDSSSSHDGTTLHDDHSNTHLDGAPRVNPSMPSAQYLPNVSQFDANTGPKGVIADARSFETAKKRTFRQTLYAFASGEGPQIFGKKSNNNSSSNGNNINREKSQSKSPSPIPDISDEDDEFMQTWRANRLAQLTSMNGESRNTRRQSPSKRRYGKLVHVDPAGYLDAIEKVSKDTVVVVLIYDDESTISNKVEDALSDLARRHDTVRFVKLHFLEAEMDEIAAPGVLAYKGGECFANLVSMVNEMPAGRDMNTKTVEDVLLRHNVF